MAWWAEGRTGVHITSHHPKSESVSVAHCLAFKDRKLLTVVTNLAKRREKENPTKKTKIKRVEIEYSANC